MALEVFVEKEIEPGKHLAIMGTGVYRIPRYVLGLQYDCAGSARVVKLLTAGNPCFLPAQEAIALYRSIQSEEDFEREYERLQQTH